MTDPLRILILEDNPADAELVQFELQEAGLVFTSKVVMTEKEYVQEIQDLALSSSYPTMTSPHTTVHWRLPKPEKGALIPLLFW